MKIANEKWDVTDLNARTFLDINSCATEHLFEYDHTMIRENGRRDYQVLYIAKGKCKTVYKGEEYIAPEGSIILFKPFERQEYTFYKQDKSVLCYVHFTGTDCEQILDELNLNRHITYVGINEKLISIFEELENEVLIKGPFYERMCSGIFLNFLSYAAKISLYHQSSLNTKSEHNLSRICKYIHLHLNENNPIEFYAKMSNLSESRFSHLFKEVMGVSPKQYILNAKLEKACSLIEHSNISITEAASNVGFDDANYFSRVMKKYKGYTPKHFKK
ncbi:MAG: AraC family transcriptional regulator [Ruminococcaceae bacterium]|nr:AraC family transcriptional regulator [Oscillospiraceae bacterium]